MDEHECNHDSNNIVIFKNDLTAIRESSTQRIQESIGDGTTMALWSRTTTTIRHQCLIQFLSTRVEKGVVLGIMSETYNKWERRAPLCPEHVHKLLEKNLSSSDLNATIQKILVQPSTKRIFTDSEYEQAGAFVQEDISGADLILGVKRPLQPESMTPEKSYLFFSHTIKGQPENMDLLHYVLENKIQLFDYECIVEGEGIEKNCKRKRLVAFGKYAGIAGAHDCLFALGRHLLNQGYSTPFLNIPQTYVHSDLEEMRICLERVGKSILTGQLRHMDPLVFCLTGKGGNVHSGALEVLQNLPYQHITVEELPTLHTKPKPHLCIFIVSLETRDLFKHKYWHHFNRDHYQTNPFEYYSVFHDTVAPYISVLVNGMYWDERYPRILTKDQMKSLYESGKKKLLVVSDISCDVNGSVEFLDRITSIDNPSFEYDPLLKSEVTPTGNGVTICGVDILPTEMPRESSSHFGDALFSILEEYAVATAKGGLPSVLKNACIAENGMLMPPFRYIKAFMGQSNNKHSKISDPCMTLWLEGHLFDSGLINKVLDVIENHKCYFEVKECSFRHINASTRESKVVIRVSGEDDDTLDRVETKIRVLLEVIDKAQATMERCDSRESAVSFVPALVETSPQQKVLVLGSGFVADSVVEYLGRHESRQILVASQDEGRARTVANRARYGRYIGLNLGNVGSSQLANLVADADVVVSLLPALYHPHVASVCISQRTNMVTASYESEDMRGLDAAARQVGISILSEVGLDPGLDHMIAMKIIDDIQSRRGTVTSFESACGGLPALECADNPFRYKFSWNPMGVLSACQNPATYRRDGELIEIDGVDLLRSAQTFLGVWPDLDLECLPNRNSLFYADKYSIQSAQTVFRGTLRFSGFSKLMNTFQEMGLLNRSSATGLTWGEVIETVKIPLTNQTVECLQWLGMTGNTCLLYPESIHRSFCAVLEKKLKFLPHDRDMVVMHHEIKASFDFGCTEVHQSSFQVLGDKKATAMSKTVGYTTGAATELLLNGLVTKRGLVLPTSSEIYNPILAALAKEGLVFKQQLKMDGSVMEGA